jgi:phosphatidylinositol phospholipase C, delta
MYVYRVKIQEDRIGTDDLVAWACIRLDRLQSGFRFIHLLDSRGMESTGALLVRITKNVA